MTSCRYFRPNRISWSANWILLCQIMLRISGCTFAAASKQSARITCYSCCCLAGWERNPHLHLQRVPQDTKPAQQVAFLALAPIKIPSSFRQQPCFWLRCPLHIGHMTQGLQSIASKSAYIVIIIWEEIKFNPPHINTSDFKLIKVLLCPKFYFSYKFISDGYA